MNLVQTLRVALRALLRNKLRSFLTTLGIIIGVSAVIAMVAIGEGAKAIVESAFAAMGSNLLIILPGSTTAGGQRGGFGSLPTLTWDDLKAIRTEVPSVRYACAVLRTNSEIVSDEQNWTTGINGTTPEYFSIRNWPIDKGVLLTDADVDSSRKVVVLGATVVENLFGPDENPVGRVVRIRNVPFQVVGILAKKGQTPTGQDYDDGAYIPQSTYLQKVQGGLANYVAGSIMVGASSPDGTTKAQSEITALLRDRHRIANRSDDDFSIRNLTEMANAQQQGTQTLTTLLASIAAVSLLVGGIGIMNIMLVSVTERTKEIGLRMAVGAKPHNILSQFLAESLALAVAGGIIGVVLGLLTAHYLATRFGWPVLVRPDIIVIAVGFSGLVGVAFGLYPARRASLLDPIEALRFE